MLLDITIVLLAGGRATRLPGKLSLPVEGEPLLVRTYRKLCTNGRPCVISVREPLAEDLARQINATTVRDTYADAGPLGALASAAAQVATPLLFAAAGDLPHIDAGVVLALEQCYLEEVQRAGHGPDAVLPRQRDGHLEPLAALYNTAALRRGSVRALDAGRRKITDALEGLHVVYYDVATAEAQKFANVNTAADFAKISGA